MSSISEHVQAASNIEDAQGTLRRQTANLRLADWRFLLTSPPDGGFDHLVLLGGPPGLADRVVEQGIARRVSREASASPSVDVLIVLHDAGVQIEDVAGCLVPRGFLYFEVDRRLPGSLLTTPRRFRRTLRNLELEPTGIYWVTPNFEQRTMYLPLDIRGPFMWYLATLYSAATPARRLIEPIMRMLARAGFPVGLLLPCFAVTAIGRLSRNGAPSLLGQPALPSELGRDVLRPVILSGGTDERHRVVMLPFAEQREHPRGVLKVARLPEFNGDTQDEQAILVKIRARLDDVMQQTVPRPLGLLRYGHLVAGIESYAPGSSLSTSTGRWRASRHCKTEDLVLASRWLALCGFEVSSAQVSRAAADLDAVLAAWRTRPLGVYR